MYNTIFILLLSTFLPYISCQFVSPCPDLFTYDNIGGDSWSGTIRVTLDTELSGIWMRTVFDRPFNELATDFGTAEQREPNEFLIKRPSPKIDAGTTLQIRITAKNNPVLGAPQLLGFRLNGKTVCPRSGVIPPPPPVEALSAGSSGGLVSPCPNLFTYEPLAPDGNRWYGNIQVSSETELSGVWMRVILDRPPVDFGTNFGEAEQKEPSEFLIKKPGNKVNAGELLNIRVNADFIPGETPPKILGFRLNGRTVCPENGVIERPAPAVPQSPCPSVFQYEPRGAETDRWQGTINVQTDAELAGIWMRVIFDKPINELGTDFGEAVRRGDGDFLIRNPSRPLPVGETLSLRITPQYNPNEPPPKIQEIRLNARTVCPENGVAPETTTVSIAQQLISPCPDLFTYEPPGSDRDRWYGVVNLQSPKELNGIWLRIILDRQSVQLGVSSNWFGEVKTEDNVIYRIQRRDFKLTPGNVVPLRFFIRYNSAEPVPKLREIKLNAVTVCGGNGNGGNIAPAPTQSPSWQRPTQSPPVGPRPFPRPDWGGALKPPVSLASGPQSCGTVATAPLPLLFGGATTEAGQWPWHVALYAAGPPQEYYCGGVLVALRYVLTAAHCVTRPRSTEVVGGQEVVVQVGKYLLKERNQGVQQRQVSNIFVHPDYDSNNYASDIAILQLSQPVDYTDYVRPVCLWGESTELNSVENREGTVVGWGYDSTGQVTDKLLKAVMPVVSHKKCIWSNKNFYTRVINDRNFCAGFRNGTSVCTGDSGGGLVFPTRDSRWQLRGLVSLSVALQDSASACDTSHYVVFTDTAKFMPWIQQIVNVG